MACLLPRGEVRAAVSLPALLVGLGADRTLLAVADGFQLIGRNTQLNQEVLSRRRAAIAQAQVVLGRASLVAVTFDRDHGAWELLDHGLQRIGVLGQRRAGILADVALVVIKIRILQLPDELAEIRLRRRGWWRWWRRRGNVHGRGLGERSSSARCG